MFWVNASPRNEIKGTVSPDIRVLSRFGLMALGQERNRWWLNKFPRFLQLYIEIIMFYAVRAKTPLKKIVYWSYYCKICFKYNNQGKPWIFFRILSARIWKLMNIYPHWIRHYTGGTPRWFIPWTNTLWVELEQFAKNCWLTLLIGLVFALTTSKC